MYLFLKKVGIKSPIAMVYANRGVIKRILNDHFDGYWRMNSYLFPVSYREDIKETVEKAIRCGTRDLGYARYECLGCEGGSNPVFVCFTSKSRFCHKCGKKNSVDW
ncbi:transposase zinc-binding domain-containing protein [Neobacillus sp. MM2021_6]|nr:transposase zinc-binding domain-containing protein [Neobacillus sp. MM2021_6]NHC21235.1 hypothetical protein [Bacillus sp. MM2020_4]